MTESDLSRLDIDSGQNQSRCCQAAKVVESCALASGSSDGRQPYATTPMDWGTDYCSWSLNSDFNFDFTAACAQHDCVYHNIKRMDSTFTSSDYADEGQRGNLDNHFYGEMMRNCGTQGLNRFIPPTCDATALLYYTVVRNYGTGGFDNP